MAYLIHFVPDEGAIVRTYEKVISATVAAEALETPGPRFILADVTPKSLNTLTLPFLNLIIATVDPDAELAPDKADAIERALPLVTQLAQPGEEPNEEEMAEQTEETTGEGATPGKKKASKKAAAKGGKKGAAAKAPKVKTAAKGNGNGEATGRVSPLAGKKIIKTDAGNEARRKEGTRRSESWAKLKSGVKYETAVDAGVAPSDLNIMLRMGHIRVE